MKEFKGTPGIWTANSADTIFNENMVEIAIVNAEGYEQRHANAKLIAAAPELLESLQKCVKLLKQNNMECHETKDADLALTKALS